VTTGDEVVTFTTSEYQRADHGKRLRLRQTRKAKP
jgi:hypothetical protein